MANIVGKGPILKRTNPLLRVLWCAGVILTATTASLTAAVGDDYFKGKMLTIFVGTEPGGGYDTYTRLMATHMVGFIPGNPKAVIKNMPGASGLTAANHVFVRSPKDGTELLAFAAAVAFAPTLGDDKALFVPQNLTWVGNIDQTTATCTVWHTSPIKSFQDLLVQPANFGSSGAASAASQYIRALSTIFGTRIRPIHGYIGLNTVILAMERGELDGSCGMTLSTLKSVFREPYEAGKLKPIVQFALKSDELKGVPHIGEFTKTEEERQVVKLIFDRHRLGRPIAGPAGIPDDRTRILRAAFDATMTDAKFLQDAEKQGFTINPMSGEDVEAFVKDIASASPQALAQTKSLLAAGDSQAVKLESLDATIAAVGAELIELRDATGKTHTVKVSNQDTQIMIGGKQAGRDALKPGLSCALSYFGEGDLAKTIACR